MATLITSIDPITLETQTYSSQDVSVLSPETINSIFDPSKGDYVEFTILSPNQEFQITDQNLENISITSTDASDGVTFNVNLDPEKELRTRGFTNGEYNVIYNFLRKELNSSSEERIFYIKEISGDRTELRLGTNNLNNTSLEVLINNFKSALNSTPEYFQDFYLNFGSNSLVIANNILVDTTKPKYDVLINLYEPLPPQFRLKDVLWIVVKTADSLAFNIQFQPEIVIPIITNPTLKSPNFDLPVKNRTNNSTNYINYEQLLNTGIVSSYDQILSYLEDKSVSIGVDYTDFSNFVHFSSAESRVENFVYKVRLIQQYSASLMIVDAANTAITSSTIILQDKISNIIKNFDGFEYYLYFESGSNTYPKSTSVPPYNLRPWGTIPVNDWYNNLLKSASIYDANNKDYLINTIPSYLIDDLQNDPYKVFVDMVGQFYDNIWVYYKDVSNRYNGDNRLEFGISKDLVADAIRSFGLKIYQNNFSVSDLFEAFTGFNSGSYSRSITPNPLPVGYEGDRIDTYYTSSQESLYTPLDDVNKEMYKRIYHNLPYLLKSKGTVAGLQNIISMFGINDSILKVSEFGGNTSGTVTGIQDITNDNIQILTNTQMSQSFAPIWAPNPIGGYPSSGFKPTFVLSSQKSIQQNYNTNILSPTSTNIRSLSPNVNTVEITFSPQNDIDNFIINAFSPSVLNIGSYIGNPSQTFLPYYPDLQARATSVLTNNELNPIAYIRLIKYFDNSLFNMIKDFIPARTNLKSGITIKPHLLNRSKIVQPQIFFSSSIYNGLIDTAFIEGGTGGVFDEFNTLTNPSNSQVWTETIITPIGPTRSVHRDQSEFYNGELPFYPTEVFTADGDLTSGNVLRYPDSPLIIYNVAFKAGSAPGTAVSGQITITTVFGNVKWITINPTSFNNVDSSPLLPLLDTLTLTFSPPGLGGPGTQLFDVGFPSFIGGSYVYELASPNPTQFGSPLNYLNVITVFSPSTAINYDYYAYNPLINNSAADVTSVFNMKVNYNTGNIIPSNFELLISGSAERAAVQDSNYSSLSWSNLRYNGSRASSRNFNESY
jgi:hypothetical protein